MTVFLDVDEVLCDFVGGALKVHGISREHLLSLSIPGVWEIDKWLGLSPAEFWAPINDAGKQFWDCLDLLPWADDLLSGVNKLVAGDWYLVTSLPPLPACALDAAVGKIAWIRHHFGWDFSRFIFTSDKHLLAGPGRILVDDRPTSVATFREFGGRAVLFPGINNAIRRHCANPLAYVLPQLENLC